VERITVQYQHFVAVDDSNSIVRSLSHPPHGRGSCRRDERWRDFPVDARQDVGYQLDQVQRGLQPDDFKLMPTIGKGVEEIRIRDDSGTYRVIHAAKFADAVFVLHAFQKKTQRTSQRDIEIAKARFREMMRDRR
jgi:phage-related protein